MRITSFCGALLVLASACSKSPPPETPAPQPTDADIAMQRHVQDSLDALARWRADSAEQARLAAAAMKARADSIENARLAAERRVQDSLQALAAAAAKVHEELVTMVHFDVARAALGDEDETMLDRKVEILNANPDVRLKITGAADLRGSEEYNLALGNRRAIVVRRYLVGKGIDAARLETATIGESSPVDPDSTEAAFALNRRAEFEVLNATDPLTMH